MHEAPEMREAQAWTGAASATGAVSAVLDRVVSLLAGLSGLVMDSMSRGHGWRSSRWAVASSARSASPSRSMPRSRRPPQNRSARSDPRGGRQRHHLFAAAPRELNAAAVLDLLLATRRNPRSVVFHRRRCSSTCQAAS